MPISDNAVQAVLNADMAKLVAFIVIAFISLIGFVTWMVMPLLRRNIAAFERLARVLEKIEATDAEIKQRIERVEQRVEVIVARTETMPQAVAEELKNYYFLRLPGPLTRITGGRI